MDSVPSKEKSLESHNCNVPHQSEQGNTTQCCCTSQTSIPQDINLHKLETASQSVAEFITKRKSVSLFSLDCQSLQKHDVNNKVVASYNSNIVLLSETWTDNPNKIATPNFDCVAKFKHTHTRSVEVTIDQNEAGVWNVCTANLDIDLKNATDINVGMSSVGDICFAECTLENGKEIIIGIVYISPNQSVENIIKFLHRRLIVYGKFGSEELGENFHTLPLILRGDFNINLASPDSQPLIEFLFNKFNLQLNSDLKQPTTRYGTTIDAVFSRFIEKMESTVYISYFSYHKPIASILDESQAEVQENNVET